MKKLFVAVAFGVTVSTTPALAVTTTIGRPDCGEWVKASASSPRMKAWLLGYMSGLNAKHQETKKKPDDPLDRVASAQQIFLWMDNYCKSNPLKTLFDGGLELFDELLGR